jgi:hypothetical protein
MDAHPVARHLFPTAINRVQVEAGYDGGDGVEYPLVGFDPPLPGARSPSDIPKGFLIEKLELIDNVHAHGLFFGWYCCGSMHKAPPLMIDAGIDVVQTSARGMEIENVRRLYSGDVRLHGPFTRRRQSNWRHSTRQYASV